MNQKYDIIIPTIEKDMYKILDSIDLLRKNLNYKRIIFIGDLKVKAKIDDLKLKDVTYLNENDVYEGLNINSIKKILDNRINNCKRSGWYLQQFLKMAYSTKCNDEYYMSWDSDTIPLKKVSMFSESKKPYFDMKKEHHRPYFKTMNKLFGNDFRKIINKSFISEHMIFKSSLMKELINELEKDKELFFEKILYSIDKADLSKSGFSEFETYGTWVTRRYPNIYEFRNWKSLRQGSDFYSFPLQDCDINILSKYYDAISFEKKVITKRRKPHNGIIPLPIYLSVFIKINAIIKEIKKRF